MTTVNKIKENVNESIFAHKGETCVCSPDVRMVSTKSKSGYALSVSTKVITHNAMPIAQDCQSSLLHCTYTRKEMENKMNYEMTFSELLKLAREANPDMSGHEVAVYVGSMVYGFSGEINRKVAIDSVLRK